MASFYLLIFAFLSIILQMQVTALVPLVNFDLIQEETTELKRDVSSNTSACVNTSAFQNLKESVKEFIKITTDSSSNDAGVVEPFLCNLARLSSLSSNSVSLANFPSISSKLQCAYIITFELLALSYPGVSATQPYAQKYYNCFIDIDSWNETFNLTAALAEK